MESLLRLLCLEALLCLLSVDRERLIACRCGLTEFRGLHEALGLCWSLLCMLCLLCLLCMMLLCMLCLLCSDCSSIDVWRHSCMRDRQLMLLLRLLLLLLTVLV